MFGKKVKKVLNKNRSVKAKRKRKISKPVRKKEKKRFVDEDLLKTLESHGFQRKPKIPKVIPKIQKVQPVQKIKEIQKPKAPFVAPSPPSKSINPELSKAEEEYRKKIKEGMEEKKPGIFSKISSIFKRKENPVEIEQKPIEQQPEVQQIITEVKGETPAEVKEVKVENIEKVEPVQEVQQPVQEVKEVKEEKNEMESMKKEDIAAFPVTQEQQKGADLPEEKPEKKKKGLFARFKDKIGLGESEAEELEPITVISSPEENRYNSHSNPVFEGTQNKEKKTISQVLKHEIMSPQKEAPVSPEKAREYSGISMLFSEKKKKI